MKFFILEDKNHPFITLLRDYKKQFPIDSMTIDDVREFVRNKDYLITGKIDGELSLVYYNKKENTCFTMSKNGRIRTDFPVTEELRSMFAQQSVNEIIAVGELYVVSEDNKVIPYPNALSILRAPKSFSEERQIRLMLFDIISIDQRDLLKLPLFERINFLKKVFKSGQYIQLVTVFDTKNVDIAYEKVLEDIGWEGLVLIFKDNTRIKVKPIITVDAIVVGIEISEKNPLLMGSLKLAFMNREGLFIFDSSVGTGFTEKERREWYQWAEDNAVAMIDNVIYVNPFTDPRIVEVHVRGISLSEGPGMTFDQERNQWVYINNYPVGSLRQPSFVRIREDKQPVPEDLRVEQVLLPNIKKSDLTDDYVTLATDKYSYIISTDQNLIQKLAYFLNESFYKLNNTNHYIIKLSVENDFGFQIGDRVISLTKNIPGTIIDYEQVFCPRCQQIARPFPQYSFPRLTITYICPECGYYLERTDVDYRVRWDEAIDGGSLYASEVHPTEITKIQSSYLTPGKEQEIIIPPNEFYPHGLTKQQIYDFYNTHKDKILKHVDGPILIIMMTDQGPVLKRYDDGELRLTTETFDELNNGRNIEFHRVIDSDIIDYGFIDIDPRDAVPFSEVKKITKLLYEYIQEELDIKDIGIYFSGNRGFYIIFTLFTPVHIDTLRKQLIMICEDFIKKYHLRNVTTGVTTKDTFIRLDVSTLKRKGSLKLPYSLSYKTGLYVKPLTFKDLNTFSKEQARITTEKRAFKDVMITKLLGYKGRFVIQEHFSKKQNKKHWDLRFEIPISYLIGDK